MEPIKPTITKAFVVVCMDSPFHNLQGCNKHEMPEFAQQTKTIGIYNSLKRAKNVAKSMLDDNDPEAFEMYARPPGRDGRICIDYSPIDREENMMPCQYDHRRFIRIQEHTIDMMEGYSSCEDDNNEDEDEDEDEDDEEEEEEVEGEGEGEEDNNENEN